MKIVITVKDTNNVIGLKEDIAMRLEGVADIVRIDTADVVSKSEVDLYKRQVDELEDELAQTYDKLEAAKTEVAREIFDEIESVLFAVARPCASADGTIIAKHSKDFHFRREDYYTIKEKYTKGGEG